MMKFLNTVTVLAISLFCLTGCIEDDYGTESSSSSSGGSPSGSSSSYDALSGSTYNYSWECPDIYGADGGGGSAPVSSGPCSSSQENYAYVFGCNQVDDFASACESFYSCLVSNSTGEYQAYYQQYLDACDAY